MAFPLLPIIAMLGGTALQYKAANDASKRATQETLRSLARQDQFQRQAEKKAMDTAQEFAPQDRAAAQDRIEAELSEQFIKPVESAQQINNAQTTTQGNVSDDYTAAKTKSNAEQMATAQTLARLMGKTTAAGRLRSNEALRMADTASDIDRLGNFSRGQAAVDEIAIKAAARPDAGLQLAGGLLSAIGGYGLMQGAGTAGTVASESASKAAAASMPLGSGMAQTPVASGMGAVDWTGATMPKDLGTGMFGLDVLPANGLKIPRILNF